MARSYTDDQAMKMVYRADRLAEQIDRLTKQLTRLYAARDSSPDAVAVIDNHIEAFNQVAGCGTHAQMAAEQIVGARNANGVWVTGWENDACDH